MLRGVKVAGTRAFRRRVLLALLISGLTATGFVGRATATTQPPIPQGRVITPAAPASTVWIETPEPGRYRYLVDGQEQLFIGMGYNPIYRYLTLDERAARYERDFRLLCGAGVNHIIGWDFDKGYEQDKFDELTLDLAHRYGIGVIMPFYLPPEADYRDGQFLEHLISNVRAKVARFKDHPALRMWGMGNEVLMEMPLEMHEAFIEFYPVLADLFHELDANHPVIYREGEDVFMADIAHWYTDRPYLYYGMHIYREDPEELLDRWLEHGIDRPLFVDEFGAEDGWFGSRGDGYLEMWRTLRAYGDYVLGGAPYTWTTQGPEPTDKKWGLMDGESRPVDDAFPRLRAEWLGEVSAPEPACQP